MKEFILAAALVGLGYYVAQRANIPAQAAPVMPAETNEAEQRAMWSNVGTVGL